MKRISIIALLLAATMSAFAQKNIQVYNGSNVILQKSTDEIEQIYILKPSFFFSNNKWSNK